MSIVPSQMALLQSKGKLKSANKGKDLLKRKADALKVQFLQVTKNLIELKKDLGSNFNKSLIFLEKANFSTSSGDVSRIVDENVRSRADVKLTLKTKPVAGVTLPQFGIRNIEEEKYGESQILGITGGGQTLNITKKHFYEFLKKIVEIATLQTSYLAIDECLKITNRRVNALEYIVVPRIEYTIKYIVTELDERAKRKQFVIERNLFDIKKQIAFERKLSKEDRDIYNCLKPFARFVKNEQFHELFEGFVLEKNLKLRLNQLNYYKSIGCNTYEDIQRTIEEEAKKNTYSNNKENVSSNSSSTGEQVTKFLRNNSNVDERDAEKDFIKSVGVKKPIYNELKNKIKKDVLNEKSSKDLINASILKKYKINKKTLDKIIDYVIECQTFQNNK